MHENVHQRRRVARSAPCHFPEAAVLHAQEESKTPAAKIKVKTSDGSAKSATASPKKASASKQVVRIKSKDEAKPAVRPVIHMQRQIIRVIAHVR